MHPVDVDHNYGQPRTLLTGVQSSCGCGGAVKRMQLQTRTNLFIRAKENVIIPGTGFATTKKQVTFPTIFLALTQN